MFVFVCARALIHTVMVQNPYLQVVRAVCLCIGKVSPKVGTGVHDCLLTYSAGEDNV